MSTGLAILSILSGTLSGFQAQKASSSESSAMLQQSKLLQKEAFREAEIREEDAASFRKKQKILFLKSGVALEGSPLLVLQETQQRAEEEVNAIRERGMAQFRLGVRQAKQMQRKGRAQLISSLTEGVVRGVSFIAEEEK